MEFQTYTAHFDGENIRLDEPVKIPRDATLVVTVLPAGWQIDQSYWTELSANGLARAYGDDEPEYSAADIR